MSSLPPPPPPGGSPFPPAPPRPPGPYSPPPVPPGYGAPPPYTPSWAPSSSFAYAGFWSRVGARLLDGLLGFAVMLPFAITAIVLVANGVGDCTRYRRTPSGRRTDECLAWEIDQPNLVVLGVLVGLAGLALWFVLYIRWWSKGQTPGMKAAGTRLVRAGTLEPIGGGRATGRLFASFLSGFFYLGYLWMLWDPQKRTWHDMMCETIVIQA